MTVKKAKNCKAAGTGDITREMIKNGVLSVRLGQCNMVFEKGVASEN